MTTKKLSLVYGTNLDYKLIRDGYKTVNGSVVVDENTPKTISLETPSLTRQYYAFTPTNNAFLTSANTNGNVNGDTSTFYATSEEVGTHQILYMLNPETNNMIEITNVELTITSSDLIVA